MYIGAISDFGERTFSGFQKSYILVGDRVEYTGALSVFNVLC